MGTLEAFSCGTLGGNGVAKMLTVEGNTDVMFEYAGLSPTTKLHISNSDSGFTYPVSPAAYEKTSSKYLHHANEKKYEIRGYKQLT